MGKFTQKWYGQKWVKMENFLIWRVTDDCRIRRIRKIRKIRRIR